MTYRRGKAAKPKHSCNSRLKATGAMCAILTCALASSHSVAVAAPATCTVSASDVEAAFEAYKAQFIATARHRMQLMDFGTQIASSSGDRKELALRYLNAVNPGDDSDERLASQEMRNAIERLWKACGLG